VSATPPGHLCGAVLLAALSLLRGVARHVQLEDQTTMVNQAVDRRAVVIGSLKMFFPFGERQVARNHHAATFVPLRQQRETEPPSLTALLTYPKSSISNTSKATASSSADSGAGRAWRSTDPAPEDCTGRNNTFRPARTSSCAIPHSRCVFPLPERPKSQHVFPSVTNAPSGASAPVAPPSPAVASCRTAQTLVQRQVRIS